MIDQPVSEPIVFPFGVEFQIKLIKVLMLDNAGDLIMYQVKPSYFESVELRWIYAEMFKYFEAYNSMPTWMVLKQLAYQSADPKFRPTIIQMLEYQEHLIVQDETWIRSKILEWIRQNIFHSAFKETKLLWDNGKRELAMDHMAKKMETINEAIWKKVDRAWFFEELGQREARRIHLSSSPNSIVTGIPDLDKVMCGGLSPGELGIWIAYAKGGKSSLLMNHGAVAVRAQFKKVLHIVLEGSVSLIENRYDSWFSDSYYSSLKSGGLDSNRYNQLWTEYLHLKNKLIIRGFTEQWDYSILNVEEELKTIRKQYGWIPDLIIIDYGDLLQGRSKPYSSPWMSERDAFRDMKLLANRGFAIWTASQAQRPDTKNYDVVENLIKVNQIAGGIEKVRVADFIGSINATLEEKGKGIARLFAEAYRDNEAGKVIYINSDLSKMKMGGTVQAPNGAGLGPKISPTVGYKK